MERGAAILRAKANRWTVFFLKFHDELLYLLRHKQLLTGLSAEKDKRGVKDTYSLPGFKNSFGRKK